MTLRRLTPLAVAACALALTPAAALAKPKPGGVYTGVTDQGSDCRADGANGQPCEVAAKVSKTGKRVASLQVYFVAECADGKFFRSSTVFKRARIRDGSYTVRAKYDESLAGGTEVKNTVSTHGTFGKKLRGDYSVKAKLSFSDGTTTTCSSGKVTFTATL